MQYHEIINGKLYTSVFLYNTDAFEIWCAYIYTCYTTINLYFDRKQWICLFILFIFFLNFFALFLLLAVRITNSPSETLESPSSTVDVLLICLLLFTNSNGTTQHILCTTITFVFKYHRVC